MLSATFDDRGAGPMILPFPSPAPRPHFPQNWNFTNNPWKLLYLSGWSWFQFSIMDRVSDPMLSHVPKSGHFLDYLNFGALFDFFLLSICWNLCNLALVTCLLKLSLPNLYKLNIFKWSNYGTKGVDHWAGLEKVLISPWLVTLLHICGVVPTPQSPISP